jgi:hypothetical protein
MKPTKLTMILCAAAQLAAAKLVSAQDSPTPTPTFAPMLLPSQLPNLLEKPNMSDMLSQMVSLTDSQKTQLQPYFNTVQPQLDAIHQRAHQGENALLRQLDASIRPLLNPEQQIKLDAFQALRAAGPPSNSGGVELKFGEGFGSVSQ